jgi:general L-amino acid transport system permease protein
MSRSGINSLGRRGLETWGFGTWLRTRLFPTRIDGAVTLLCLLLLGLVLPPLVDWAVLDATWRGEDRTACVDGGACWVFVQARLAQFLYGFYPEAERWRVDLCGAWLALWLGLLAGPGWPSLIRPLRGRLLIAAALPFPVVAFVLLTGGWFGLAPVETRDWGGLMLTLVMTLAAGAIAMPLAILLALGRRSALPVIRAVSVAMVEFWRGVPIITVIFLASILLPLVMPDGVTVDKLLRAVVGLGLVVGAYMAEVIRGSLQVLPEGQAEGAQALGLGYWPTTALIVLPQALRLSIPGLINEFIALLKNTTLVLIVSLFDLLGIVQAALADPKWVGLTTEAYGFVGAVFWLLCFGISRYGAALERRYRITR